MASRTAVADSYEEVRLWVYSVAHSFHRTSGGDLDDWIGEANLAFLKAVRTYDPEGAKFSSWVGDVLINSLTDKVRRDSVRRKEMAAGDAMYSVPVDPPSFDWRDFACGLSEDAGVVIDLVFETPCEMVRAMGPEFSLRGFRRAARRFLWAMGWTNERISAAYREIREAL